MTRLEIISALFGRIVAAVAVAALLAGCANLAGPSVSAKQLGSIKTVGVISAAAYTLHLNDSSPRILLLGAPSFEDKLDIGDTGLDELTIRKAALLLSPHYAVKSVDYGGAGFLKGYDLENAFAPNPNIGDLTAKLVNDGAIDAYVVLYPSYSPYLHSTGLMLKREGLSQRSTIYEVIGNYFLEVVDAHTHRPLARRIVFFQTSSDSSAWPQNNSLTETQKARLKADFEKALEPVLESALQSVGLLQ